MLTYAIAQINPVMGDFEANKSKILDYIIRATTANTHVDLVVFPECAICGYPPEDLLFKKKFLKRNIEIVKEIAQKVEGLIVILGFIDGDYNALAVLQDGVIKYKYHKRKLPNYGVFDEQRYFKAGNKPLIIDIKNMRCAMSICEDIWEDDTICEETKGVDLIINISASPYHYGKEHLRKEVISRYAKKSAADILYCNLVGGQDELVFDGGSFYLTKEGRLLKQARLFTEELLIAETVKPNSFQGIDYRETLQLVNKDPKVKMQQVYEALVLGTHDYVFKSGFNKVLIGLSGGIDSALVAAIAVDALGKDKVVCISMPTVYSSAGTKNDARVLAQNLGVEFHEIAIEGLRNAYKDFFTDIFKGLPEDTTEENIQARIRGNILMAMSNKFGALVLTTGNKSEIATGYCTLYGDMAGGFAIIKDIPKTMVFALSKEHKAIPASIITRPPSAELRPDQKDEDSLPSYAVLDKILVRYIEKDYSLDEILTDLDVEREVVERVISLVDFSEYKRRQAAIGIKIMPRAFGKDRRMPIVNKFRDI
ncbi:MAG: NAD+ synthase [bacterium]|nr:NAD+ synthase [bacterium]